MKKITLQINGREMNFSKKELEAIVEKHVCTTMMAQSPTEEKWFEVDPNIISQNLFKQKRVDKKQEAVRQMIIAAIAEMQLNPKYQKTFKTLMPRKTWSSKTVMQLAIEAKERGDEMATWIHQALEWAQRITNGESWEEVCNAPDTTNWYRLIFWKNGCARLVGGSITDRNNFPASKIHFDDLLDDRILSFTVPLIVSYS